MEPRTNSNYFRELFRSFKNIGDRNTDFFALNDDFAAGDRAIIRQYPNLVVLAGIELDDGSAPHTQKLLHRQDGLAKHD